MSFEYFKCLICHKYFEDLCKVDSHNQNHTSSQRKRGIPVQALTFMKCRVVIQRHKQVAVPVKLQPTSRRESVNLSPEVTTLGSRAVRKCRLKKRKIIAETESDEELIAKSTHRPSKKRPSSDLKKGNLGYDDPEKTKICPIKPCAQACSDYYRLLYHLKLHCKAERKEDIFTSGKKSQLGKGEYTNPFYLTKTFFCKVCMKSNISFENLRKHLKKAHSSDKIECPYCQEDFGISALKLMAHMRATHRDKLYMFEEKRKADRFKCDKCHYSASHKARLDHHKKRMHEKIRTKTPLWSEKFIKKCQEDESFKKRPWPCLVCPARFNLKRALQLHFVIHLETGKAQHVCDYSWCRRKYTHRRGLVNHVKVVHAGKVSGNQNNIQTHQIPNPPKEIYSINNSEPKLQPQLNIQTKTEVIDEIHLIDKIILNDDGEAVHLKGECLTPIAPEISDDCRLEPDPEANHADGNDEEVQNKKAALLALLKAPHIPMEDPIFSKIAEKNLSARLLIEKLKSEEDPKGVQNKLLLFKCSECKLEVKRAWRLQYHMKKVHKKTINDALLPKGQILMMCGKCAYRAKDKADLDKHMKIHKSRQGQKGLVKADYQKTQCGICGDNFSNPDNLRRHINYIHMEKKYKKKNRRTRGNDNDEGLHPNGKGNADNNCSILGM